MCHESCENYSKFNIELLKIKHIFAVEGELYHEQESLKYKF